MTGIATSHWTTTTLTLSALLATGVACGVMTRESVKTPGGGPAFAEPSEDRSGPVAAPPAPAQETYARAEESRAAPSPAPAKARAPGRAGAAAEDAPYRPEPAPEDRPGLGTEWGETRESRVSSAPFERQDFDTPLSTTSIFYNDDAGVRAMLGAFRGGGFSEDGRAHAVRAARGALTIRVVDERGAPLPSFSTAGKSYVIGHEGARYALRIENHTSARFEAVATVDGLDVIDGQPGSFAKRGYLIQPWSNVEIDGFRRSEDEVAAFRFGRVRDSYAAKRGDDRHVGVIGVAIFEERGASWPWTERELQRRHSADPFPGRFAPAP